MTPGLKEPGMDLQSTGLVFVLMIKKEHLKSHHLCKVPSNPVQPPSGPWIAVATPLITGGRGGGDSLLSSASRAPLAPPLLGMLRL